MIVQTLAVWASALDNPTRYARLVYRNPGYRCVFINTLPGREPPFNWEKWVRMFPMYDTATEAAVAWVGHGVLPEGATSLTEP